MNYYSENDPFAASWLRELIADKLIPEGKVDGRSIKDVKAKDLEGFKQCHFFAGIGGWPLALDLAGWSRDREVWTGSCPCQPFSDAGARRGTSDERHLWPEFKRIIRERGKRVGAVPAIFGEQVASKDGRRWLSGVRADLERLGYAVGGADLCAASVAAPHKRQRLFWVAYSDGGLASAERLQRGGQQRQQPKDGRARGGLHDAAGARFEPEGKGSEGKARNETRLRGLERGRSDDGRTDGVGDPLCQGRPQRKSDAGVQSKTIESCQGKITWRADSFVRCSDGRARRVEPHIFPLVDAGTVRNRVGLLRGSGNAIVPILGAEFVRACEEARLS